MVVSLHLKGDISPTLHFCGHPASSVCTSHTELSTIFDIQKAAHTCCWVDGLLCHMCHMPCPSKVNILSGGWDGSV